MEREITLPILSTQKADSVLTSTYGIGQRSTGDSIDYVTVPVLAGNAPVFSTFAVNLNPSHPNNTGHNVPSIDQLVDYFSLGEITSPLRRDFFIYGNHVSGGVYCRHNDNSLRNVRTEGDSTNDIRNAPETIGYPVYFIGEIYIIYANGAIYKMNALGDGRNIINHKFK